MKSDRFCRDCGSPARGNPCLYYVGTPHEGQGYDPPCSVDDYVEHERRNNRVFWRTVLLIVFWAAVAIAALVVVSMTPAAARLKVTAEVRQACGGDVVRFCLSHTVGNNRYRRLLRCLKSEREKLSPECRAIIFK